MAAPWERREGETDPAWAAFIAYRDMGLDRSTAKVSRQVGKNKGLMDRWSSRHGWVERVAAWDAERDRVKREAELDETEAMGRRHAQQAQALLQVLTAPAVALIKRLQDEDQAKAFYEQLHRMPAEDALALIGKTAAHFPNVMKVERLARGESTERVEGKLTIEHVGQIVVEIGNEALKYIPDEKRDQFRAGLKRIVQMHVDAA